MGKMIGLKTMLNEFMAFSQLGKYIQMRKYNEGVLQMLNGTDNWTGNWTLEEIKRQGWSKHESEPYNYITRS